MSTAPVPPAKDNSSAAVRRALLIVELLVNRFFDGISGKDLVERLGTSAPTVTRDMQLLEKYGWVKKLDNGLWTLSEKPLLLLQAFEMHCDARMTRIRETQHNVITGARRLVG